ncbi:hypothetical protein Q5752_000949 [Cryptotrichosporon argae]
MSLRPSHASPHASPDPSAPMPTTPVEEKHRAQLASYRRSSSAGRPSPASKLAKLARRLSRVDEDAVSGGRGAAERKHAAGSARTRTRTWLAILGTVALYLLVVRPYLSAPSASVAPEPASRPRGHSQPLHARGRDTRAPLPPAVQTRSLPDHAVRDGLLRVDPDSKVHPVYQLVRDARDAWDAKIAAQSTTLAGAVAEYRRRHGRAPPRGFDKWWAWVCEHGVELPDEYDQIERDLKPFRALHPRDLKARIDAASRLQDTYTLKVRHGSIRTSSAFGDIHGADQRLEGQTELLRPVAKWINDFAVVYSVHDTPSVVLSDEHRRDLLEHADEDEYIDIDDELDLTLRGWAAACPPGSKARHYDRYAVSRPEGIAGKTFIGPDHLALMDVCAHPELIAEHGVLSGKTPRVGPLVPLFSLSKTTLHADVLGAPTEHWVADLPLVDWDARTHDALLWRGSNTGAYFSAATTWRASHRARLVRLAAASHGNETILPAPRLMRGQTIKDMAFVIPRAQANAHAMDIKFTNKPLQCDEEDGTCRDLENEFVFAPYMTQDESSTYKYVIDIDGNAWSARFQRLLMSGSLVFKSTIMPEWWTDRIQPWVHYIPIQVDYSDLYDAVTFFRGDFTGRGGEPALARDIAAAGRAWARAHWRKADMTAYVFRLYLEWARLLADHRPSMDFVYDESMERTRERGEGGEGGRE